MKLHPDGSLVLTQDEVRHLRHLTYKYGFQCSKEGQSGGKAAKVLSAIRRILLVHEESQAGSDRMNEGGPTLPPGPWPLKR